MRYGNDLRRIFQSSVAAVQPHTLFKSAVKVNDKTLHVFDKKFTLKKPCYLVGFGKAVYGMAVEMERMLGENLKSGIVTIPEGIRKCFESQSHMQPALNSKIIFIEGARDNLPDVNALQGAIKIKSLCDKLEKDDLLIVLSSGGGSALLPLPRDGIKLDEKLWLIKELANSGANIVELNCVRKRLSQLKGGGLADSAYPCKVIALIISDVIGDPLDIIASGPTVKNSDDLDAARNVVEKYKLTKKTPTNILRILDDTLDRDSKSFHHVHNFIIGNNKIACEAAKKCAEDLGYESVILSTSIQGDVEKVAEMYAKLSMEISSLIANPSKTSGLKVLLEKFKKEFTDLNIKGVTDLSFKGGICIISGGEPTVVVKNSGIGGRNQHLALQFSSLVSDLKNVDVEFLSCGTDGIDGPTDAAGAIGTNDLVFESLGDKLNPEEFLHNNDSYNFYSKFKDGQFLVRIGHTGTNVMDIHVLLINHKEKI